MPYSKEHKLQSKDRILQSATELFSRYGFDKVSISQIMKLARMTHGAFYAHFESKEALYNASFLETFRRSRAARLVKGPISFRNITSKVSDYLNLRYLKDKSSPGPEAILFNEIGSNHNEIKHLYEEAYERIRKMLERRITALGRLNKLPYAVDKEIIAEKSRAIMASLVGAIAIAKSIETEEEQRNILLAAQKQIFAILGVNEEDFEQLSSQQFN